MTSSRQKSCGECSKAKRRCDLQAPCSRCTQRSLRCVYTNVQPQLPTPPSTINERNIEVHQESHPAPVVAPVVGPDFVIDPALDVGFTGPEYTTGLHPVEMIDLDFMSWQTTTPAMTEAEPVSNKLRIEEILRTGADYRRADYNKVNMELDEFAYEAFSDPNSRYSCSMASVKRYHVDFATKCQTIWLHPRLYKDGMPDNMLDVFGDCVLYANKTAQNEALIYRTIERNMRKLMNPQYVTSVEEHLARLQALLLYQSMRLFDTDVRQRSLADDTMEVFEQWTDLLADLRDASSRSSELPGATSQTWEHWILSESMRRTVIACYGLITIFYLLKQKPHNKQGSMRPQPWTISRHLWEALSSFDFDGAWQEKPRFHITCMGLDDFLRTGRGEDVDEFGRMMLVTYMGLDETKQWFKDHGSCY